MRAGTSEWTTAQITEAWGVADRLGLIGPAMEQPEYNLLNRKKARRRLARDGAGLTGTPPLTHACLEAC